MLLFPANTQWDIFCCVVDNYGDIGVCWRLARQLANEQKQQVRLWVDDLQSFQRICSAVDVNKTEQQIANVTICYWDVTWHLTQVADIVIEAFACNLPDAYIEAMAQVNKPVLWLNLEYLTYEAWSEGCHGLPSLQAKRLIKYFFFTGLPTTGGIIREQNLLEQIQAFKKDIPAQHLFLKRLGVEPQLNALLVLVFSYANAAIGSWLDSLRTGLQTYQLLIPQTPLLSDLANYLKVEHSQLKVGYSCQLDNLRLQIIPFVEQVDFDKLLSCCDLNIVRGEDSFVRAQFIGQPLLWHIYTQEQAAHLDKLEAFLKYYLQGLSPNAKQATIDWWLAWNQHQDLAFAWKNYQANWMELKQHAQNWAETQKTVTDLLSRLANFYKNWLSYTVVL